MDLAIGDGFDLGRPVDQRLPVAAYTSTDWFRREASELFGRTWQFAGMAEDMAAPGDFVCVDVGNTALFVIRRDDGQLAAFHNTCRHRGTRLLDGRGNAGRRISCFYHRWSYDLDGRLAGVPRQRQIFPALDKDCLSLHPAAVGTWRNMVFVHPDPGAGPLSDWLGAFPSRVGPHDPEALVEVADVTYRVRANWKIVIENFIDAYHFFYLHQVSLGDGDFDQQAWSPVGPHMIYNRPLKPGHDNTGQPLPVIDGVPVDFGAGAHVLFPNLAIYERGTYWLTFHVHPKAADLSWVQIRMRAAPSALERELPATEIDPADLPDHIIRANGPYASLRAVSADVHPLESNNVTLEDIYACEAVQRGLSSSHGAVGQLSSLEAPLAFFQEQVARHVGSGTAP